MNLNQELFTPIEIDEVISKSAPYWIGGKENSSLSRYHITNSFH